MGALEALAEEDSLTLTLSNGATWNGITAASVRIQGGVANTAANVALVSGGDGESFATFRVTAGGIVGGSNVNVDPGTASLNMSATPDTGGVTITAAMSGFVGGVATSLYGSPLTFNAVNTEAVRSATVTAAGAGVFDVASGFADLVGTPNSNTSAAATVLVTNSANATVGAITTGVPSAGPSIGGNYVTISGPMTGVGAITGSANAATSAGAAAVPAATGFAVDTANDAAYGYLIALNANDIQIVFDGSTAYDASAYTAVVSTSLDGNYAAVASIGSGTTHTFTRNGSSFTTNSFGSLNKMTVTDLSGAVGAGGADGAIAITAYDTDGTAVTCTGLTIANLGANGTTTIQGADVIAACAGAKRIDGLVNSTSIQTTNTKITADGATSQSGITANTISAISN